MVRGELKRVRLLWIKAIPTNKRQPRSERTLARTLNGAEDNWEWCPQRLGQQHSRVVQEFLSTKREYAKGRRYEVAHLKCIRAIQHQGTFRRFLFKYNRWIYIVSIANAPWKLGKKFLVKETATNSFWRCRTQWSWLGWWLRYHPEWGTCFLLW